MAGDWLKVEKDTPEKPEVIALSCLLGVSTDDAFGKCFRLWRWADSHTEDGFVRTVSPDWVDSYVGLAGFATALIKVGWLRARTDGIEFPHFDRHCGETAKARASDAKRKKTSRKRSGKASGKMSGSEPDKSRTREEKRREEDSPPTPAHAGGEKKSEPGGGKEDVARAVVGHYQQAVAPEQGKARGAKNVLALLGKGFTPEQLRNAADGYAAFCREKGKEPRYRLAVGNFYGQAAAYEEYLNYAPPPRAGPSDVAAKLAAERRQFDEEVRRARDETLFPEG